jgi:peptidoglycan-associated lipoprotein
MIRFLLLFLVIVFIAAGCSQNKRVAIPEQSEPAQETKAEEKPKASETVSSKELSRDPAKESITEKQLAKAQPAETQPLIKELQAKIKDIYFDYDKADIRDDAKPVLKEVAVILSKNGNIKVIIEGHCDDRGTNEYNLSLGDKRATSAKQHLVSLGIPSGKTQTISYGEEKPICSDKTEECWAKNRRAHFVLIEESR